MAINETLNLSESAAEVKRNQHAQSGAFTTLLSMLIIK